MTCRACQAEVPSGSRYCPACGRPVTVAEPETSSGRDEVQTHRAPSAPTDTAAERTTSGSGWLTSSGAIDHGRFAPGSVFDGRYRIVGLLGRGGMGEVFRADDLRLGQEVALKFLPPSLGQDPTRLAQFHNEVRTARQVSHANVCRVYDVGEVDHQIYLSMEYVNGEDLSSLLRRIGRLPEDKAVEIARQICAGLAAAHERGVIHRDLKPANIMIDGDGRARVMDFSLAAVGKVTDIRSGTPGYMAPEQLAGREVTLKSDIYSLGLVLYELFTGKRAFEAKTLDDLLQQHESGSLTSPVSLVKTLDPAIDRAILRCLEKDPASRPANALAVAAALPGGDPLAAALAAGEMPSPAMVAAVGGDAATLSPLAGVLWVTATVAFVVAAGAWADHASILAKTPFSKPAAVLADRAEDVRANLGYTDAPVDRAFGFSVRTGYLDWAEKQGAGRSAWSVLASGRPASIVFWYRTSPGALVPLQSQGVILPTDPPMDVAGMTDLQVDPLGRLVMFQAVPPEVERAAPSGPSPPVDWTPLFAAAGLDPKTFADVAPERTPATFADERRAWQGTLPGTKTPIRIEAAAYRGRPVAFHLVGPWTRSARDTPTTASSQQGSTFSILLVLALLVVAAVLARRHIRSGHADVRGARRLAIFAIALMVGIWATLDHVRNVAAESTRLIAGVGLALFLGGVLYLIYLALEPYVRRSWPTMLVGWSRVLGGQVRDPMVGRDFVIGATAGALLTALNMGFVATSFFHHGVEPQPVVPDLSVLVNVRLYVLSVFLSVSTGLQEGLLNVLILVMLRELVRTTAAKLGRQGRLVDRVASGFAVTVLVLLAALTAGGGWTDAVYQAAANLLEILVILQVGLVAGSVMYFADNFLARAPLTLDAGRFYASEAWISMAIVVIVAAVGFWFARADDPLLSAPSRA